MVHLLWHGVHGIREVAALRWFGEEGMRELGQKICLYMFCALVGIESVEVCIFID